MISAHDPELARYEEIVRGERTGDILVGIDRIVARRLYTDVPISVVLENTGEAPYIEKAIGLSLFILGPAALLASIILSIVAFWWWAILVVPAGLFIWGFFYSTSSIAGRRAGFMSVLLITAGLLVLTSPFQNRLVAPGLFAYTLVLWCTRVLYTSTTGFFRLLVLRNYRAYVWLKDSVVVRAAGDVAGQQRGV